MPGERWDFDGEHYTGEKNFGGFRHATLESLFESFKGNQFKQLAGPGGSQ